MYIRLSGYCNIKLYPFKICLFLAKKSSARKRNNPCTANPTPLGPIILRREAALGVWTLYRVYRVDAFHGLPERLGVLHWKAVRPCRCRIVSESPGAVLDSFSPAATDWIRAVPVVRETAAAVHLGGIAGRMSLIAAAGLGPVGGTADFHIVDNFADVPGTAEDPGVPGTAEDPGAPATAEDPGVPVAAVADTAVLPQSSYRREGP
jgi:hypothetical protein